MFVPIFKELNRLTSLNRMTQIYRSDKEMCVLQNEGIKSSQVDSSANPPDFNGHAPRSNQCGRGSC